MHRLKGTVALAVALIVLGLFAAKAVGLAAAAAAALVRDSPQVWTLALGASNPAWLASVCPGFKCVAGRVASPAALSRGDCVAPGASVSAGLASCGSSSAVTLTWMGAEAASVWVKWLSLVLGGAGFVVLSSVVIIAMRLR
jgi:hypothetical protein